jgi:dolichol-phosphate mannosyltransferase
MDAGGTHKPADVPRLIYRAKDSFGLVIGSRFMAKVPLNRRSLISKTAAKMFSLLNIPVRDATSGFRCWDAALLERVVEHPFRAKHFAFQLETLFRADRLGAKITEEPIAYRLTNSSFNWKMLVEALRIYWGLLWT